MLHYVTFVNAFYCSCMYFCELGLHTQSKLVKNKFFGALKSDKLWLVACFRVYFTVFMFTKVTFTARISLKCYRKHVLDFYMENTD